MKFKNNDSKLKILDHVSALGVIILKTKFT